MSVKNTPQLKRDVHVLGYFVFQQTHYTVGI